MADIPESRGHGLQAVPFGTPLSPVAYTASAASSAVFGDGVSLIRIIATTAMHYSIAASPTATANDIYLPADTVEYRAVSPGQKISAIRNSSDGTMYVEAIAVGS